MRLIKTCVWSVVTYEYETRGYKRSGREIVRNYGNMMLETCGERNEIRWQ